MQPVSLSPLHDDPRLGDAKRQQDIFTDHHDDELFLRAIPWENVGRRRGFIQSQDLERQALVNDFAYHGIPIQVRLHDLDALRAWRQDPELTELVVMGPGRQAVNHPDQPVRDEAYTITAAWQDFPPFFANWLNYRAAEDPALGAPWSKAVKVRTQDDNGETSVHYRHEPQPGRRLFAWRTPADAVPGQRPSGLILPATFNPFADGDEEEEAPAPPAPAKRGK